jgi:hypothetical protein
MVHGKGPGRAGFDWSRLHIFCVVGCNDSRKNLSDLPFHRAGGLCFQGEDLSKTESGIGSLILQKSSSEIGLWTDFYIGAKHVRTSRGECSNVYDRAA